MNIPLSNLRPQLSPIQNLYTTISSTKASPLYLIDGVQADDCHLAPLGDEDDVVALQEPDEPHNTKGRDSAHQAAALPLPSLSTVPLIDHGQELLDLPLTVFNLGEEEEVRADEVRVGHTSWVEVS